MLKQWFAVAVRPLAAGRSFPRSEIVQQLVVAGVESGDPALTKVNSIEFQGAAEATAHGEYAQRGSRGRERSKVTCRLTRQPDGGRVEAGARNG